MQIGKLSHRISQINKRHRAGLNFQKQQSTVTLLLHGKSIVQHKKHSILWKRFQCLILVSVRVDVLPVMHVCMLTLLHLHGLPCSCYSMQA